MDGSAKPFVDILLKAGIKEQKIRDPDDPNSNEYGTYSTYYGTCKVKTQAF